MDGKDTIAMRIHPWKLVGVAFAAGAMLVLYRRSAVLQRIAELAAEVAAAVLVAHAKTVLDQQEARSC
jgi:hypothetical protein